MIRSQFNADTGMLETVFNDTVSLRDLRDYMESINRDTDLPESLNILIDTRDAVLDMSPGDIRDLAEFNFSLHPRFRKINNAIVSNQPNNTAFMLLYESLSRSKHYRFKVFNLPENALEWLKNISVAEQ
ncbi:MAG: hypothetical protein PHX07_04370 [Candidatus Marinimicrobia bacterium]|jgi:hypothetical protein|nr:hypothetical protein [Candidatus Neomarinimicrobiota bacterium]MDD4961450.1 hypothetical protein [Candidatus Neomarinimicrobiota bacterium]MDD5709403.1 hypothetical protein [Candidatus Neomarinimicrobiota bacterium]MDX9777281.1 hypothetical protein [bacterium]